MGDFGLADTEQEYRELIAASEKINYSAQDSDILTASGFRPDAASWDDNREKFTPAQNLNYVNKRAELTAQ